MNLIVTCARHLEPEASEEIKKKLEGFGDTEPKIKISSMSGILTAHTALDPVKVVNQLRDMIIDEPWSIRYCLRIIPVQKVTETKSENIVNSVSELLGLISDEETYRISIEKRNSEISRPDLINEIAKKIKNKVSLEHPDKIVQIEILGIITGISILKKTDILSLEKIKRNLS